MGTRFTGTLIETPIERRGVIELSDADISQKPELRKYNCEICNLPDNEEQNNEVSGQLVDVIPGNPPVLKLKYDEKLPDEWETDKNYPFRVYQHLLPDFRAIMSDNPSRYRA